MKLLKTISEIYNVPLGGLISKRGKQPLPEARHIAIWYLVRCEDWTITDAAKVVNTSVSNAIIKYHDIENMRNFDKQIRTNINHLLIRMRDVTIDKMDTYVISRAYPWGDNLEIEITSDRLLYCELGSTHSGCQVANQDNEKLIHQKCNQIADLIRDIERLNIA